MRKPNKYGCVPSEDVCLKHCLPLECKHGCKDAVSHLCKEDYESFPTRKGTPIKTGEQK
jgi:hypothetical protein